MYVCISMYVLLSTATREEVLMEVGASLYCDCRDRTRGNGLKLRQGTRYLKIRKSDPILENYFHCSDGQV